MKKIISSLLSLCILLSITSGVQLEAFADSYENFKYVDYGDTITIEKYEGSATDVTVPSVINGKPVTVIQYSAFICNNTIRNVVIPNSVKEIGVSAFCECENLVSVTLPELETIEQSTFSGCTALKSVTIPDTIKTIEYCSFYNCDSLKSITIPDSVETIEEGAFMYSDELQSIELGDGLIALNSRAFENCPCLKSVSFGKKIKTIGENAFFNCIALENINIPDSVTTLSVRAFSGCTGLKSVKFGNGLKIISEYLFDGCSNLSEVILGNAVTEIEFGAFESCSNLSDVTLRNSLTKIGNNAFNGCTALKTITFPISLKTICGGSFTNTGLEQINYAGTPEQWKSVEIEEESGLPDNPLIHGKDFSFQIGDCGKSVSYLLNADTGVLTISGTGATKEYVPDLVSPFDNNSYIKTVVVEDGITSLGFMLFNNCKNLNNVSMPDTVTVIDSYVFSGCSSLNNISIPGNVSSIGAYAFENCAALTSITLPESVNEIQTNAFFGCSSLKSVTILNEKCNIYSNETTIPDNTTIYGHLNSTAQGYAKNYGKSFVSIDPIHNHTYDSGTVVKNPSWSSNGKVKYSCTGCDNSYTEDIYLEGSCGDNANYSFDADSGSLTISGSGAMQDYREEDNDSPFYHNPNIKKVDIKSSITKIGTLSFGSCENLKSVIIPNTVKQIGAGSFVSCKALEQIDIPDSVTAINMNAFYHCSSLAEINIGSGLAIIGDEAFEECFSVKNINVSSNNKTYSSVNGVLFNANKTELLMYPTGRSDESYTAPSGTKKIGYESFMGAKNLKSVTLPDTLTEIGEYAFQDCTGLSNVDLPESITVIDTNAFGDCEGLTEFTVPNNTKVLGVQAFVRCSNLKTVYLPESLEKIDEYAFFACENLKDVYYVGSKEDWNKISILKERNDDLFNATIHFAKQTPEASEVSENSTPAKKQIYVNAIPSQIYTGKAVCPNLTVYTKDGKKTTVLNKNAYNVTYKNNKDVGIATATVKGQGVYAGTVSVTFVINPKSTSLKSLKKGKKQIKVSWIANLKVSGYQLQLATNKNFKGAKTVNVGKAKSTSKTVKNLKAKKKYYVRIRTYKKVGGRTYCSAWSKAKTIKTK